MLSIIATVSTVLVTITFVVIVVWAWSLFRESVNVLLETAPKGMDVDSLHDELCAAIPEISEIYDMHIWVITTNMYMFSTHIALSKKYLGETNEIRGRINDWLKEKHAITHTTVEFDIEDDDSESSEKETTE